jgi:hypothetical protein
MVLRAYGVSMLILVLKTGQNLNIGFVPKNKAEQKDTKSEQQRFPLDSTRVSKLPTLCGFLNYECAKANVLLSMLKLSWPIP